MFPLSRSCSLELAASERWKIRADGARSCAFLFATQDPRLFLTRQGWSSTGPARPSESCSASGVASASALLLSRLCVSYLCILVSQRLPLCLCHCLFLFSLLLLAPVDIKVIKDLPWPPPVGQLDSSPSLPDGDRDISGPASPLPEPSLEDSSGGSFGDLWPG